jgi:hypothetical protein
MRKLTRTDYAGVAILALKTTAALTVCFGVMIFSPVRRSIGIDPANQIHATSLAIIAVASVVVAIVAVELWSRWLGWNK